MDTTSPQSNEGRIIAQRKVLSLILARLAADDPSILETFESQTVAQGYDEDPGSDPSPEFAIEAAIADKLRLILDAARRRLG
jgi:hypothetical protein